ncbi:MAG TPA: MOSC domain-containing protein [Rhizomicrobium sp.]|nr:MOSC domain-containing protein [Rhizomicrobium sp.]
MAHVVQLNVSRGGLPKRAIAEAEVSARGISGDGFSHPYIHGRPHQALLLITSEGVDELTAQGFRLFYGALGENITTGGLDRHGLRPGQRYRIGEVIIELTEVREPCASLNVYGPGIQKAIYDAGGHDSPRWGLTGFYAAVLQPGMIRPGDPIQLLEALA